MRIRVGRNELEPVAEPLLQLQRERGRPILADVAVLNDVVEQSRPPRDRAAARGGVDRAVQRPPSLTRRRPQNAPEIHVFQVVLVDRLRENEVHRGEQVPGQRAVHAEREFQRLRKLEVLIVVDDRRGSPERRQLIGAAAGRRLSVGIHRERRHRVVQAVRRRRARVAEHGLLLEARVAVRVRHPDVGGASAEYADAAPDDRSLGACHVVVEAQSRGPEDVAARRRARPHPRAAQRRERNRVEAGIFGRRWERRHINPQTSGQCEIRDGREAILTVKPDLRHLEVCHRSVGAEGPGDGTGIEVRCLRGERGGTREVPDPHRGGEEHVAEVDELVVRPERE